MGLFGITGKKTSAGSKQSINDLTADQCVNIEENLKRGMAPKEVAEDVGIDTDLVYRYKRYRMGEHDQDNKGSTSDSISPIHTLQSEIQRMREQLNQESYLRMQYEELKDEIEHKRKIRELELATKELEFEDRQLDIQERRLELKEEYGDQADDGIFGEMTGTLFDLIQKAKQPKQNPVPAQESQLTLAETNTKSPGESAPPGTSSLKTFTDDQIRSYIDQQPKMLIQKAKKMNDSDLFAELQNRMPGVSAISIKRAVELIKGET